MAPKAKPQVTPNDLSDAIELIRRSDASLTVQALAKSAGVATAAVVAVRNSSFAMLGDNAAPHPSERMRRGWAETLARLVTYANRRLKDLNRAELNVDDVLRYFGLDPEDTDVVRAVRSVESQSGDEGVVSDAVLRQIALRKNRVSIGLLRWPPFFTWAQKASESWAHRYTSRLVGSVNPYWILDSVERDSFDEAVTQMGAGSSELDLVFGVYNTPYRRLRGLDFIDMPGLAVPLAMIVSHDDGASLELWRELLDPTSELCRDGVFLTLPGEVGELFLRGPCQIDPDRVRSASGKLAASSDRWLEDLVFEYQDLVLQQTTPSVICADRAFCVALIKKAKQMERTRPEIADFCRSLSLINTDELLTPRYNLGLAVRADSKRWAELLRDAQVSELFGNAIGQTAASYVSLLLKSNDEIQIVELISSLGEARARRFVKLCEHEVARLAGQKLPPSPEKLKYIRDTLLPKMLDIHAELVECNNDEISPRSEPEQ